MSLKGGKSVKMGRWLLAVCAACIVAVALTSWPAFSATKMIEPKSIEPSKVISLDGDEWQIATDPSNVGKSEGWWKSPRPDAKSTVVPRTMQSVFPGYNGAFWYWRDTVLPKNPHASGRYLLRFWDVDYYADVWMNDTLVGSHEGLHCPFTLDVTDSAKPGAKNRIAVRVIYPGSTPIDGFTHAETAHSWSAGVSNGGVLDSVELLIAPAIRLEDLYVVPDPKTGRIAVEANIRSASPKAVKGSLVLSVADATGGGVIGTATKNQTLAPGDTLVRADLRVANPKLWDVKDPYLYCVTARVAADGSGSVDETSTRCGFKDFRFENGYFRLNGKRIFLRSSHMGPEGPVGGVVPHDMAILRRELENCKAMGFNMVRFLARAPMRYQLEIADEIGLMVYEESSASWMFANSDKMGERFDRQVSGMIRRDRNHPSIAMWGLLNETGDGLVFQHAVRTLPLVRSLDKTRPVILASGRFDAGYSWAYLNGLQMWKPAEGLMPCALHNSKPYALYCVPLWPGKSLSLNPGAAGEYSVARWTAPADGEYSVSAKFRGTGCYSTTDLHILQAGKPVYEGFINANGWGDSQGFDGRIRLAAGETIDFVVGWAGGMADATGLAPWTDTTQLEAITTSSDGTTYDVAKEFSDSANPKGVWTYGWMNAGPSPDVTTFTPYAKCETIDRSCVGGISNPGSTEWEPVLADLHTYPRVPHRELEIERLRTVGVMDLPLFLSEYGIGSGVNYPRLLRHFEETGDESTPLADSIRDMYNALLADWVRWKLGDTFASPEDFLDQCVAKMGNQRRMGINALRSNPNIISYSLTGTHDPFSWGEGAMTLFREQKPGTFDCMVDAFAPLKWCLFAEPVSVYSGSRVKIEAVIANEDVLPPGEYPARLQVIGPQDVKIWEREVTVRIPAKTGGTEPSFATPVFSEEIPISGSSGKYRLNAKLLKGGAASGENIEFYVTDRRNMPAVKTEVVLWGDDPALAKQLAAMGIKTKPFESGQSAKRQVILVAGKPGNGDAAAWRELVERIACGSTAVFLCPEVFLNERGLPVRLPMVNKGAVSGGNHMGFVSEYTWPQVYPRDEWAKRHPIFDGLPTGLMDYTFYREIIPDYRYLGQDTPDEAIAGSFRTSAGFGSDLMLSVYKLGSGRFILNALRVRQALGQDPTAERLLRNMLNYAAIDADKPVTALPADFDAFLGSIGY